MLPTLLINVNHSGSALTLPWRPGKLRSFNRMSRKSRWKPSSFRRAGVLMLIAAGVLISLLACRYFADFQLITRGKSTDDTVLHTLGDAMKTQEWKIYDRIHQRSRLAPMDPDIIVLGIDEACLAVDQYAEPEEIKESKALQLMINGFPFSRELYGLALDRLVGAGAKTVVIDLMFPTPSGTAPEGDEGFKAAIDRHDGKVVIGADFVSAADGTPTISMPWEGFIPPGWPADKRLGFVSFWAHDDGVIRSARFFLSLTGEPERALPSFSAAVMRLQGMPLAIPLDATDHLVRFSKAKEDDDGPEAYRQISLMDIFVPAKWERNFASGAFFKGKTVFIGPAAQQMQDFKETPVGSMLGVQLHAHTLGALKSGSFIHELPFLIKIGLLVAAVFAAALLVWGFRRPFGVMLILVGGVTAGFAVQWWCFDARSLVVPVTVPLTGWVLCGFIGLSYDFVLERRNKEALRRRIGRFHSPDMVAAILADPEDYERSLAGARRSIALLFSDVRGFTTMSENMEPEAMIAQLTEYLDRMVEVVFKHDGAIDKFIGDAVMAAWGRLRQDQSEAALKKDAVNAVSTALEMIQALAELNESWKARGMEELHIGIGIHQGVAIVGELGSGKSEFTAIGDTVNSASRLESATKQYGVDLIISDVVKSRVSDEFVCRSADLVKVKGKAVPLEIYTVQGRRSACDMVSIEVFESGITAFRAGRFAEANAEFEKARDAGLDDGLTKMYLERCDQLIADPPEAWDGVWTLTKK